MEAVIATILRVWYSESTNPTTGEVVEKFVADIATPNGEVRTVNVRGAQGALTEDEAQEMGSMEAIKDRLQLRSGQYGWYAILTNREEKKFDFRKKVTAPTPATEAQPEPVVTDPLAEADPEVSQEALEEALTAEEAKSKAKKTGA